MNRIKRAKLLSLLALILALGVIFPTLVMLQTHLHEKRGTERHAVRIFFLPSKLFLDLFSLGFDQIISDYFWIKAVTFSESDMIDKVLILTDEQMHDALHSQVQSETGNKIVYQYLELATHFDPKFIYAYEFGGTILAWDGDVELANNLLERGLKENPKEWKLAYYLGFNHYFFLKNYIETIRWFKEVNKINPSKIREGTIASLYLFADRVDTALKLLETLYKTAKDTDTREYYAEKIRYFLVEKHLKFLNQAIKVYNEIYHQPPEKINDLLDSGIITNIPVEPFGGEYMIDHTDHTAVNQPYKRLPIMAQYFGARKKDIDYRPAYEHQHEHNHAHDHDHGH
ncbi:MAG: hypothetical protein AB1546_14210 [bacterium]